MTTATAKTIKCALSIGTPTYCHRIDFEATGDRVQVVERTRDELCGNYNPHTSYTLSVEDARAYYRDRKAVGYR